jgi:hypothetical protein
LPYFLLISESICSPGCIVMEKADQAQSKACSFG